MTDRESLLRAVNENPNEDVPRLAYADELDEYAATDAERARAELIRLQVEYATELRDVAERHHDNLDMILDPDDGDEQLWKHRCWALKLRFDNLIRAYSPSWRRQLCPICEGSGGAHFYEGLRGPFVRCLSCDGTGSTGALSERVQIEGERDDWKHAVAYVRGFPVVTVPFTDTGGTAMELVPANGLPGDWHWDHYWLTWAVRCVREEGASFHLTGVDHLLHDEPTGQYWWRDSPVYNNDTLPAELLPPANEFISAESARAALDATVTMRVVERAYPKEMT